jgi:uncharacterized membrane protein YfcA
VNLPAPLADALALALGQPASLSLLAMVAGAFIVGGLVKGLLGVGLPLVIVPLLALIIPSPKAIALMGMPILVSNLWQSIDGGHIGYAIRRFTWLLVPMVLATALTVRMTLGLPVSTLNIMVACAVLLAVALIAWQPKAAIAPAHEKRWSFVVGLLSGALGGVSTMMGPLIISYLVALRLPREQFIGSISVIYLAGAVPLFVSMIALGVMGWPEGILSALSLAPMFVGMSVGKRLRRHVSEAAFRKLLLGFLTLVAVMLLVK